MRIAVISDVHGNLRALEAVLADLDAIGPDLVVHGGDLCLNGPRPAECLDLVREREWSGIAGNTDQALWQIPDHLPANTINTFRPLVEATRAMIGAERERWLRTLPDQWRLGAELALVHAVPGDSWRGMMPDAPAQELGSIYAPLGAALAVYGHIHRPYVRALDQLTVANSGSVGLPWDGDSRASYLLIEDGQPVVRRVAYDVERHLADLDEVGYPSSRWLALQARTAAGGFVRLDPV